MNEKDLVISIKSTFDGKGSAEAQKQLEATGKKAEDAGKSALTAQKGFTAMGQAAAATSGGIGGLADALGDMAQQIPALAGSARHIGLAIDGVLAWKKAISAVIDSQESLAKGLRDTAAGNAEAGVKTLTTAYAQLRESISDAADAAQDFYDAEASRDDAQTRADLAALDLEKAQRAYALSPDDKFGARRLDLDIAEQRAAIQDAAAQRKADRELNTLRSQSQAAAAAKAAAAEQMAASQSSFSDLGGQFSSASDRMRANINAAWTPAGREKAAQEGQRELARIGAAMESAAAAMRQAAAELSQSDRALNTLDSRADASIINRSTLGTTRQTGTLTRQIDTATYDRDLESERQRLAAEAKAARAAEAQARAARGPLSANVLSAEANLRTGRNAGASSSEVTALKAELSKALDARKAADAAIIDNARLLRLQAQKTEQAIRDIEARGRRQ